MAFDAMGLEPSPGICTLNRLSCALTFKNAASILFSLQTLHHPWLPSDKDETCGISAQPGSSSQQSRSTAHAQARPLQEVGKAASRQVCFPEMRIWRQTGKR